MRRSVLVEVAADPSTAIAAAHRGIANLEMMFGESEIAVSADAAPGGSQLNVDGRVDVLLPFFGWFFRPMIAILLRRAVRYVAAYAQAEVEGRQGPPLPKPVPGLPTVRFDAEQSTLLAAAAAAAALAGFGSALYGQQADFVADAFHASDSTLGVSLAISRFGVVVALVALSFADRRGRRRLLLLSAGGLCACNLLSAAAPSLAVFTGLQLGTRGFVNATIAIAGIAAIEEAPEGARGFSAGMIGLASGFGFACAVLTLPLSDISTESWRIAFGLSGLTLLFLPAIGRALPESKRYLAVAASGIKRGELRELFRRSWVNRLLLLAGIAFFANVLSAPVSQLSNKFLSDDRGFSGSGIAVFRGVTAGLPGFVGLLVAMRLVEVRGRRGTGAAALFLATAVEMVFFVSTGAAMWVSATIAVMLSAVAGVALSTLSTELFPTEVRATANGVLLTIGVLGSAVGLTAAGALSDQWGDLGRAIAVLGIPSLVVAAFLVPRLPEPAGQALDAVSPPEMGFGPAG